jgi:glycosyltransferase involved in cell wall biosynthesis
MIIINTYNRLEMLTQQVNHFKDKDKILIIDDCSPYDVKKLFPECYTYSSRKNGGKREYYKQWAVSLSYLRNTKDNFFLFIADDQLNFDWDRAMTIFNELDKHCEPFAVNNAHDGRKSCWTQFTPKMKEIAGQDFWQVGFVDCGFFCNRLYLELLEFKMFDIDASRFVNPNISSGVGEQLSKRTYKKANIYLPQKSFVTHGKHESTMHKELRKQQPLIAI